jgi:acyl carrier protein
VLGLEGAGVTQPKQRSLSSLLESGFANGYEQFKELIEFTGKLDDLPASQKAFGRLLELSSVAVIEGLNRVEDEFGIEPVEALVLLWRAVGTSIACANAQAFVAKGRQQVRREMLAQFKDGYDVTMKSMKDVDEVPFQ